MTDNEFNPGQPAAEDAEDKAEDGKVSDKELESVSGGKGGYPDNILWEQAAKKYFGGNYVYLSEVFCSECHAKYYGYSSLYARDIVYSSEHVKNYLDVVCFNCNAHLGTVEYHY